METTQQEKEVILNGSDLNPAQKNSGEKQVRIPKEAAIAMKQKFSETSRLLTENNIRFKEPYRLSVDNLEDMLWINEDGEDKYNEIRFYFIYYYSELNSRYVQLAQYDKTLYLAYTTCNNNSTENFEHYTIYSATRQVKLLKEDFDALTAKYRSIVKRIIDARVPDNLQGNTDYIRIPRVELLAYYAKISLYNQNNNSKKIQYIDISLAEALDIRSVDEIENLNEDKEKTIHYIKTKDYVPNQLTAIFDAIDENGNPVENLSYYDMNSLCPNQCP